MPNFGTFDRLIIAFTGKAGCGKNTAADYLCDEYGFEQVAFADALRDGLMVLDPFIYPTVRLSEGLKVFGGWDNLKRPCPTDNRCQYCKKLLPVLNIHGEVRRLMQNFGTDVMRSFDPNFWINQVRERIVTSPEQETWVITDCRFDNEARFVRRMNGMVVEIERLGVEPVRSHASEEGVSRNLIDRTVVNDKDLAHLYAQLDELTGNGHA